MGVLNGARYLEQAVESVLRQTFTDFELIIVDDGSTDATPDLLARLSDPRIVRIRNPINVGVSISMNHALTLAQAPYIARMDADDVMQPDRLARQVAFLEQQPEVGVLGTYMTLMDAEGQTCGKFEVACDHEMIAWSLLFGNMIANPSTLIRRGLIEAAGGYEEASTFTGAEDFGLWVRLVDRTRFANLPERLMHYRVHPASLSSARRQLQQADTYAIRCRFLTRLLGAEVTLAQVEWLARSQQAQYSPDDGLSEPQIESVLRLILNAYEAMCQKAILRSGCTAGVDQDRIRRIVAASRYSPSYIAPADLARYWQQPLGRFVLRAARAVGKRVRCWPEHW